MKNNKHILSSIVLAILIVFAIGFGVAWKYYVKPLQKDNDGLKVNFTQINQKLDELKK